MTDQHPTPAPDAVARVLAEYGLQHHRFAGENSRTESGKRGVCMLCTEVWPCPTYRLAAALAAREQEKDNAYLERNRLVALLARIFPSGLARTAIVGWSEDWHGCVYIDLPTGQASWHFHDSQAYLFAGLPAYRGTWDGHTTEQKYERVAAVIGEQHSLRAQLAAAQHKADEAEAFTRKYLTAIANTIGIQSPIELIARAENNEENFADILLRVLTERLTPEVPRG